MYGLCGVNACASGLGSYYGASKMKEKADDLRCLEQKWHELISDYWIDIQGLWFAAEAKSPAQEPKLKMGS